MYKPSNLPKTEDFETKTILKQVAESRASLAELKGYAPVIPNLNILINALTLQEAKDSSAVENIITTHDEIFKAQLGEELIQRMATKEVQNYITALQKGVKSIKNSSGLIDRECILDVQNILVENDAGLRELPGTVLKNDKTGEIIYEPPQNNNDIQNLLSNLLDYINIDDIQNIDPLIKMAIIHFQFESIHPFYDGNGRTGRIINLLYLLSKGYLDSPVLYLSRFINQNKNEYYSSLQDVRDSSNWERWILFILVGVDVTSRDTIQLITLIKNLMSEYKRFLRDNFGSFYSQDLLNNLFKHPYTKIDFLKDDLGVTRQTASKYLNELADHPSGLVKKVQIGKFSYFINVKLYDLFSHERSLVLTK